jgi:glyoxylase-like metal-dependent hydrolase (beta-lactamase superfamily II)
MKRPQTAAAIVLSLSLGFGLTWQVQSALAAAPKPLQLEVFTGNEDSWGVTSTLIYGKTEAILVDCQFRVSQAKKLADRVAATGRRLKGIFITHPDYDHYIGTAVLHERFPGAPIYMTAAALAEFKRTSVEYLAMQKAEAPSETPASLPTPEVLPATVLRVDGRAVDVIKDFQGDVLRSMNSFVWVPFLDAVIAGDVVFSGVHPWLADSSAESRAAWHHSLELVSALHPGIVVAGHKANPALADSPDAIAFMHNYLNDFESAKRAAANADELVAAMTRKYSDLTQKKFLTYAAKLPFPSDVPEHTFASRSASRPRAADPNRTATRIAKLLACRAVVRLNHAQREVQSIYGRRRDGGDTVPHAVHANGGLIRFADHIRRDRAVQFPSVVHDPEYDVSFNPL